jgi:hypothetical protein
MLGNASEEDPNEYLPYESEEDPMEVVPESGAAVVAPPTIEPIE